MINNYVKHKQIENQLRKKYQKHQVALVDSLDYIKNVFSIQEISQTLNLLLNSSDSESLYNHFVDCMRDKENEKHLILSDLLVSPSNFIIKPASSQLI